MAQCLVAVVISDPVCTDRRPCASCVPLLWQVGGITQNGIPILPPTMARRGITKREPPSTVGRAKWVGREGTGSPGRRCPLSRSCLLAGETFLPYYTGRAIDGIVIQKSMEQFSTAVIVMCLLAIGR